MQDFESGSFYGLEKFWAFHHYNGLPKSCNLEINAKVSCTTCFLSVMPQPPELSADKVRGYIAVVSSVVNCDAAHVCRGVNRSVSMQLRKLLEEDFRTLDDFPRGDRVGLPHLGKIPPNAFVTRCRCRSSYIWRGLQCQAITSQ